MATFQVHEDIENAKPKQLKALNKAVPERKRNRSVLQPLVNCQPNVKMLRIGAELKENLIPLKKGDDVKSEGDSATLKAVLKRPNLVSKICQIDPVEKEYEEDVWQYLKLLEKTKGKIKPSYMTKQLYLSWDIRSVLVDWLVSVAAEYNMNNHTVHLSVNYLDRFLSNVSVIHKKLQLVGAAAMLIAGKVEEIYPPAVKEWSYLTDYTFTVRQIIKMEQLMLKVLDFKVHPPTMLDFIKHLCAKHSIDNKTKYLAMYLSELVLLEGEEYLQYFPSKLASASLVLARHTLNKPEPWTKKLEETAGYSLKQLSPVVQKQQKTFKSSPFKEQQAIQKKYASDKYQSVALLKPRVLILDEDEV